MAWVGPWRPQGHWYRGCLHIHTQASDGVLTPSEVIEKYKRAGYHFVCITDHDRFTDASGASGEDFLVLGGIEITCGQNQIGRPYHIVGVGIEGSIRLAQGMTPQQAINAIRERGGLAFVGHPYWSGHTFEDLIELDGIAGLEVFNGVCELLSGKGLSAVQWDDLLARKKHWLGAAVDDFHWGQARDFEAGWVVVRAPSLDEKTILSALGQGIFYSSQGPRIINLESHGPALKVQCSGSRRIDCIVDTDPGNRLEAPAGKSLFDAEFTLPDGASCARVQCIDAAGLVAWSNPIFLT